MTGTIGYDDLGAEPDLRVPRLRDTPLAPSLPHRKLTSRRARSVPEHGVGIGHERLLASNPRTHLTCYDTRRASARQSLVMNRSSVRFRQAALANQQVRRCAYQLLQTLIDALGV